MHFARRHEADVIPIAAPEPEGEWLHVVVKVPPPRPRIAPGAYQARSATLTKFNAFNRVILEFGFEVYRGEATDGIVLARIPHFVRLPGPKGLAPSSKLARLLHVAYHGQTPPRWGKLSLSALQHKLWRVVVADAEKDTNGQELPERLRYSVIAQVLERLA